MLLPSQSFRTCSLYFAAIAYALSTTACSGGDDGAAVPNESSSTTDDQGAGGNQSDDSSSSIGGSGKTSTNSGAAAKGGNTTKSDAATGKGGASATSGEEGGNDATAGGAANTDDTTSSAGGAAGGTRATNGSAAAGGSGTKSNTKATTAVGGAKNTSSKPSAGGVSGASGSATSGGAQNTSSGTGGSTKTTSSGATCHPKFSSGVNVAWFNFASDIPSPDIAKFTELFKNVKAVGGTAIRWWFHTTGMTTPGYDSSGKAKPISDAHIADLKKILDAAHKEGVGVVISLWSFGMLDSGQTTNATVRENNKKLLEDDTYRQAYIDNVLTKMVTALKGYPGLFAWEIFNEPEGMSSDNGGWTNPTDGRTKSANLQKTVNWFTSAIHDADPSALVTNGANNFATLSPSHGTNLWSDAALTKAGGKANGVLDFYEAHYYNNWNGANANSPFLHPSSYWGLDKQVVIGEFWTDKTDDVEANDLFTNLYASSYAGAWAWQYANLDNPGPTTGASTKWPAMQTPMTNLYTAHPSDLTCQ